MDTFSQGLERLCPVSGSVLHGIEPRLKDFHQLLLHPPKVLNLRQQSTPRCMRTRGYSRCCSLTRLAYQPDAVA